MLKKERISESELLTRLLEGERQAFDEIFTRYYTSLCAFANLYVKQTEVAENIVQDLCFGCGRTVPSFRFGGPVALSLHLGQEPLSDLSEP